MKNGILIIMVLCIVVAGISCDQDIPDLSLPAKTQEGLNTLGFIVDDKVWTNYGTRCTYAGCDENQVRASLSRRSYDGAYQLSFSGGYTVRGKQIDQSFAISVENVASTGEFTLDSANNGKMVFTADHSAKTRKAYWNIEGSEAFLKITEFDTLNNIIAGEFQGILIDPEDTTDNVQISDGRFDVELVYYR